LFATVTIALAVNVASEFDVAITVCVPGVPGAVYRPFAVMIPVVASPPATLSTVQETAVLGSFVTEAVNCHVPDNASVAELGESEIDGVDGAVTVTDSGVFMNPPL
jgi:hypothetical protein